METETKRILLMVKNGELTIDQGQRQPYVLFGKSRSSTCKLDRLPNDCSIYQNRSFKECESCGHYQK